MSEQPAEEKEPEQIKLMKRLVEMSGERTKLSAERNEQSAERCYQNTERTLSSWTRTALELMVFGIAIDRFGLLLRKAPQHYFYGHLSADRLSHWGGAALVALGVLMSVTTGIRFLAYALGYRRAHGMPDYHGPYLAPGFTFLVAIFGIILLIVLFALT
ncbi:MAG: YidH family protein [Gammaproteobacteria bacterium]